MFSSRFSAPQRALTVLGVAAGFAFAAPVAQAADTYQVDESHAAAIFKIKHFDTGYTYGMFRKITGSMSVDLKNPANSSFKLEIPVDSLFTNHEKRDQHLKSPDFFDAKQYPTMRFKSTKVRAGGKNTWKVTGDLTIHGVTKSITVDVEHTGGPNKNPYGQTIVGFHSQFDIKRSDFKVAGMPPAASDTVTLILSVEGARK